MTQPNDTSSPSAWVLIRRSSGTYSSNRLGLRGEIVSVWRFEEIEPLCAVTVIKQDGDPRTESITRPWNRPFKLTGNEWESSSY